MIRRRFGRSGMSVPVIGFGTYRVLDVTGTEEASRKEVVRLAQDLHANFYDSSPMYGEAERVLGDAIRDFRNDAIVATKVWAKHPRLSIDEQIERALSYYGGVIDVYQIHNLHEWERILDQLEALKEQGNIKAIGITHYLESSFPLMMEIMSTGRVDCIQIPYNIARWESQQEILGLANTLDLGVIVMEPLGAGELVSLPVSPDISAFKEYGCSTWPQLLLKYIISDPRVHVAIPATSSKDHMRANAETGEEPMLSEELRSQAEQLYRSIR